jgi:hypothetical protein
MDFAMTPDNGSHTQNLFRQELAHVERRQNAPAEAAIHEAIRAYVAASGWTVVA